MKKRSPFVWAWVLVGLLAVAAGLVAFGRQSRNTVPSAASYEASGLHALFELLQAEGYRTEVSHSARPKLLPGEVALAAFVETDDFQARQTAATLQEHLAEQAAEGVNVVCLSLPPDFASAMREAEGTSLDVARFDGKRKLKVSTLADGNLEGVASSFLGNEFVTWRDGARMPVVTLKRNSGTVAVVSAGLNATNHFIDRNDNATYVMEAIRSVAPRGARIVFCEAAFGLGSEPGMIESLGLWAVGAWWQLGILFVIAVYALGKPFGLPEVVRAKQVGGREMIDAVANIYRRARAGHVALGAMTRSADAEIRRLTKLPRDAGRGERDRVIPEDLVRALAEAEAASTERLPAADALKIARRLEESLEAFRRSKGTGGR